MTIRVIHADVMDGLRQLPDESVHCCVTSPPYWQLRDYGYEGQIGLEPTIETHVEKMVEVFREVRRVLRKDGTLFLNYGDMYAGSWGAQSRGHETKGNLEGSSMLDARRIKAHPTRTQTGSMKRFAGLKPKDLVMMPERVALALQADGWWVRDRIIWHKPNPMPSSTEDRCTPSYEIVWHMTKAARYFWDAVAIAEPAVYGEPNAPDKIKSPMGQGFTRRASHTNPDAVPPGTKQHTGLHRKNEQSAEAIAQSSARTRAGFNDRWDAAPSPLTRNRRNVWTIATEPYKEAHFATMPTELARLCIAAGTSEHGCCSGCGAPWQRVTDKTFVRQADVAIDKGARGANDQKPMDETSGWDGFPRGTTHSETVGWVASCNCNDGGFPLEAVPATVLDPFGGSGTTGLVADRLQRNAILIEASDKYVEDHIKQRIAKADGPLLGLLAGVTE